MKANLEQAIAYIESVSGIDVSKAKVRSTQDNIKFCLPEDFDEYFYHDVTKRVITMSLGVRVDSFTNSNGEQCAWYLPGNRRITTYLRFTGEFEIGLVNNIDNTGC